MNKYELIQRILETKKMTPSQKERFFLLVNKEIKKEHESEQQLSKRLKILEDKILVNNGIKNEQIINEEEKPMTSSKLNIFGILYEEEKRLTKEHLAPLETKNILDESGFSNNAAQLSLENQKQKIITNHNPQVVFNILKSFKFEIANYRFKYLVHGTGSEFEEKDLFELVSNAKSDFESLRELNAIPYELFKSLLSLINIYDKYGLQIVKNEHVHPFDSANTIELSDSDKKLYWNIFGNNQKFKSIATAVQNFKKKYRFDNEPSESSDLKDFLRNIIKFQKHSLGEENLIVHSFDSSKNTGFLFSIDQIIFDIKNNVFFAWNPPIKKVLSWIFESILKHSNIEGVRNFNSSDKEITVSSYKRYDDNADQDFVYLDILDKKTFIQKDVDLFLDAVKDKVKSNLTSVCDFEVFFSTSFDKHFACSILPDKGKEQEVEQIADGLLYRFKFLI